MWRSVSIYKIIPWWAIRSGKFFFLLADRTSYGNGLRPSGRHQCARFSQDWGRRLTLICQKAWWREELLGDNNLIHVLSIIAVRVRMLCWHNISLNTVVLNYLAKQQNFKTQSKNYSFTYKNKSINTPEKGNELPKWKKEAFF